VRIEYLDFRNLPEHREYRLRVYGLDGSTEFRFRIANAAFGAGRVRLQDGPNVCYQRLLRAVAAGETANPEGIPIDDMELLHYRNDHPQVPKYRSWASSLPPTPAVSRRQPVAPPPAIDNDREAALEEGQRVSHASFGDGVTTSANSERTVVRFDQDGPKIFVTSMLKLDVLSGPHTWETGPRGNNRPTGHSPAG
jgi:hypothetical protein